MTSQRLYAHILIPPAAVVTFRVSDWLAALSCQWFMPVKNGDFQGNTRSTK